MCSIIFICLFVINYIFANADLVLDSNYSFALSNDNGQPLFLTPYITNGRIEEARAASKVGRLEGVPFIPSYSGFLTVNQEYNSNIFFWFFPTTSCNKKAPVILWLQGGPGASGLIGLFTENGPYVTYANSSIGLREIPWTQSFQMIYVDSPVGSGFSFTNSNKGYSKNQEEISDNLYEFLQQFFILFDEYRANDLYIAGESYGGKHAPSLAYKIHINGPSGNINLKGMTVGNGFTHPPSIAYNVDLYHQLGLLDDRQTSELRTYAEDILQNIRNNDFEEAFFLTGSFIPVTKGLAECLLTKYASYTYLYNFLYTDEPEDFKYFHRFIELSQFRKATHVGNLLFKGKDVVRNHLRLDIMKSSADKAVVVMNNYKVLFYNGVLDLVVPYVQTAEFLRDLEWKYANEYRAAERKIWKINENEIAGYFHHVHDFFHASVLSAGHLVPHDKPRAAFDLISRFINGTLAS